MTTRPPSALRAITRDAVRTQLSAAAVDLFTERGFENVTVEQIAAEVGISPRSFHRYFAAKEDAVVGDPMAYGEFIRAAFAARPAHEAVWVSLRLAYEALLAAGAHDARSKAAMRLLSSTASLRARNLEKHLAWADMLTPLVADRLHGPDVQVRSQALVQASMVCFDVAMTTWAAGGDERSPVELLEVAFTTLGH